MILFYQICAARGHRWSATNGLKQTEEGGYYGVPKRDWIPECAECVPERSGGRGAVVDEPAPGGCGADISEEEGLSKGSALEIPAGFGSQKSRKSGKSEDKLRVSRRGVKKTTLAKALRRKEESTEKSSGVS